MSREIWIGTNALAKADGLEDYRAGVVTAHEREGLTVIEIEEAEPLRERLAQFEVDEEILQLVPEAASNVVWDVFDVYERDAEG